MTSAVRTVTRDAAAIGISRASVSLASIVTIFVLGSALPEVLAQFSVGLAFCGILFALVSAMPLGCQAELSRLAGNGDKFSAAVLALAVQTVALSLVSMGVLLAVDISQLLPASAKTVAEPAAKFAAWLAPSLPLAAVTWVAAVSLEALGRSGPVARLRLAQSVTQVLVSLIAITGIRNSLWDVGAIAVAYVCNDLIYAWLFVGALVRASPSLLSTRQFASSLLGRLPLLSTVAALFERGRAALVLGLLATFGSAAVTMYSTATSIVGLCLIPAIGAAVVLAMAIGAKTWTPANLKVLFGASLLGIAATAAVAISLPQLDSPPFSSSRQMLLIVEMMFLAELSLCIAMNVARGVGMMQTAIVVYWITTAPVIGVLWFTKGGSFIVVCLSVCAALTLSSGLVFASISVGRKMLNPLGRSRKATAN